MNPIAPVTAPMRPERSSSAASVASVNPADAPRARTVPCGLDRTKTSEAGMDSRYRLRGSATAHRPTGLAHRIGVINTLGDRTLGGLSCTLSES
ncbi:Uncharacterised protein [Mycobacteroides abscessus subsp. abscessus]|nr:Uncharacterised protein [Mycobacteroides abscessus subsp. abscessus]